MKENKEYIIKVDKKTLYLIVNILELYIRLGIGQIEVLDNLFKYTLDKTYENINYIYNEMKNIVFGLEPNEYYGIYSHLAGDEMKKCYDLMKKIQNRLAIDDCHDEHSTWHRPSNFSNEYIGLEVLHENNK